MRVIVGRGLFGVIVLMVMLMAATLMVVLVRMIVVVIVITASGSAFLSMIVMVVATSLMVMMVIVVVIMTAAVRAGRLHRGQIEERHDYQADAGEENHGAENAVRRQVVRHTPAHMEVEQHRAPEEEERHADEMNRSLVHGLKASEVMSADHGMARAPTRMKSPTRKPMTTRRLNTDEYMKSSLMSIIGPKTRKASFAA